MKILVLDDNEKLLTRLTENITEFEVVTSRNIDEALRILKTQVISFIAVDYDLGNDKTGDMLYVLLFRSGKSIPAIVFSANDLSEGTKKYLDGKGFSKVLSKIDEQGILSDLLVQAAKEILANCAARVYQVRKAIEAINVGDSPLLFNNQVKTIYEWIKQLEECKHSEIEEKQLKELIVKHCLAIRKREDGYVFPF